jgi:acyl-CoA thioesterase YciA
MAQGRAKKGRETEPRTAPRGELQIRAVAMPADTNQAGDIFGGWVLSQMDVAGGTFSWSLARGRVATVAIDGMTFKKPVHVGDVVSVYADLIRIGTSSITVRVEAWVLRRNAGALILVTEGSFTYVALDGKGKPRKIER